MPVENFVKERACILVKAYPQSSQKYKETVCCAAISESGELRRLYPIPYRQLLPDQRFNRFDWIEAGMTRASGDPRPESYKVNRTSIRITTPGKAMSARAKAELWLPHVVESLTALKEEQAVSEKSLGIVHPDPGSVRFLIEPVKCESEEDRQIAESVYTQVSLFQEDNIKPLEPPEYAFKYSFTSGGTPHTMTIHDWEVQQAYRQYKRTYRSKEEALEKMREYYEDRAPKMNLHLIMGNMQKRRGQFIIIGVLRTSEDLDSIRSQQTLF